MNRKGFTLIEMLVVVAIVGILSATVLAALGPARNKAKDARIISGINQALIIAETMYDSNSASHYTAVSTSFGVVGSDLDKLKTDVTVQGGTLAVSVAPGSVAFTSPLASGGTYCSDSLGKTSSAAPAAATPGTCN